MSDCHAYLDESGQRDLEPPNERYFVVGGVICASAAAPEYEAEIRGLKRSWFHSTEVEIKSTWLRNPDKRQKHYLDRFGISEKRLEGFVENLYDWVLATDLFLLAGIVDKELLISTYKTPHHPSGLGYNVFLQRYQKFLLGRQATGSVVFDEIAGKSRAGNNWAVLLKKQHTKLLLHGCPYTGCTFDNVSDELVFANSRKWSLLQIGDLVSYNVLRQFRQFGDTWDDAAATSLEVYPYFRRVLPLFDKSPSGVFAGYGIAKLPSRCKKNWTLRKPPA